MKVMFIGPPFEEQVAPPIGLGLISAVLKLNGHETCVRDAHNMTLKKVEKEIKKFDPQIIGIPIFSPARTHSLILARFCKKLLPDVPIILGGPHATHMTDQLLTNYPFIDFIIRNEGEYTILKLVNALKDNKSFTKIKGLSFRKNKKIVHNPQAPFIQNLDELPFADFSDFDLKSYAPYEDMDKEMNEKIKCPVVTTRGCPFSCIFCSSSAFWGHRWRFRTAKNVVDEIEHLHNDYGAEYIRIFDDNFLAIKKRVTDICNEIIKRGLNKDIIWRCEGRPDSIDTEMYKLMKKAGCHLIEFGVETGSEEGLKALKKMYSLEHCHKAFQITKEIGIKRKAFIIIGGPHETRENVKKTANLIKEIDPDMINVFILAAFPGTELYETMKAKGLVNDSFWLTEGFHDQTTGYWNTAPAFTGSLTLKEAVELKDAIDYWWNVKVKRISPKKNLSYLTSLAFNYLKRGEIDKILRGGFRVFKAKMKKMDDM